jgi:hypothetical protein
MLETEASRERWSVKLAFLALVVSFVALLVTYPQWRSSERAVQVAEHARQDSVTEAERQRIDAKNTLDQQRKDAAVALEAQTKRADQANALADRSAKTAAQQLEMSERPWVVPELKPSAPLEFTADGRMGFWVLEKFTNIGHSVALNVNQTFFFTIEELNGSADEQLSKEERQKDMCDRLRATGEKFPSFGQGETLLFPNDFTNYSIPIGFSKEDVEKVRIRDDYIWGLLIVGCVDYTFSFSSKHHQTRYIYEIVKAAQPGQPEGPFIRLAGGDQPIRIGETVPPNQLAS